MKSSKLTASMDEFQESFIPLLLICSLIIHAISSAATNTINTSQSIRDGETLVSSGGMFELGFFSPGNSRNRYLGIWYKNITVPTVVWVANRQVPLTNKSGVLTVIEPGSTLVLLNDTNGIIWSSNASRPVKNPVAQLLDTGNLVVKDANDDSQENFLWQSFDYPSDSFLPGMMSIGWNYVTGEETYLSSWTNNNDPAPGEYSIHLDPTGYPQLVLKRGEAIQYRVGPWNGLRYSGAPDTRSDSTYKILLLMNKNEVKYGEYTLDQSVVSRSKLNPDGIGQRWTWNYQTHSWSISINLPADNCDNYNVCGAHGICNIASSPPCGCLDRFVPQEPESGIRKDRSNRCERRTPMNCQGDVFLKYSGIKLPDSRNSSYNEQSMTLANCEAECSRNCSCLAYTQLNISGAGSGCLFYYGDLIDIRTMPLGGQDLYIRMASTELENVADSKRKKKSNIHSKFSISGRNCSSMHYPHFILYSKHEEESK